MVKFEIGELEPGYPLDGGQCAVQRPAQLFADRPELQPGWHGVEPAQPHIDGVYRPPANELHQLVTGLLQRQPSLDRPGMIARHAHDVGIAEEVRSVQQVDVQSVTVDPFTAIQQPPKRNEIVIDLDATGVFDRIAGTDLVGDWADSADPRGQVRRLGVRTPAQKRLEKPWRLIDVELDTLELSLLQRDVQRAFTFHPRQRADTQRAGLRSHCLLRSAVKLATLNVENTRSTSPSDMPSRRSNGINVAV